jgi:hypothetical protein
MSNVLYALSEIKWRTTGGTRWLAGGFLSVCFLDGDMLYVCLCYETVNYPRKKDIE